MPLHGYLQATAFPYPRFILLSLNELEQAGMVMRVRQGVGEVSHMYILLPKEDSAYE